MNRALFVAAAFLWAGVSLAEVSPPDLRTQLRELALTHHFSIHDLDRIDETSPGKAAHGSLHEQLKHLLEDYSHIVLSDPVGSVTEVRILGSTGSAARPPRSPGLQSTRAQGTIPPPEDRTSENKNSTSSEYRISTRRNGDVHTVHAFLLGRGGKGKSLSLTLDPEGTAVVVPVSMSRALGFEPDELEDGWADTGYGGFAGKLTTLRMIRVADVVSRDVEVAFIQDEVLGEHLLLGVKVFKEFSTTLNEADNEIVFVRK
jgi:hypothetical protein